MNIFNWFKKPLKTNYPPQVIPDKPLALLERIDNNLVETNKEKGDKVFFIEEVKIPLSCQHWSIEKIYPGVPSDDHYVARSIAFYIQPDGTWVYLIGVFRDSSGVVPPTEAMIGMWIELLTRTNNGRT